MTQRPDEAAYIFQVVSGHWFSRALWAAAHFRIADAIGDDQRGLAIAELAKRSGTLADRLRRVMDALVSIDIFERTEDGLYRNNSRSRILRSNAPETRRAFIACIGGGEVYEAFGGFEAALREDLSGFKAQHGLEQFDFYSTRPAEAQLFAEAMTDNTRAVDRAVANHGFAPFSTVVDVGGSNGALLRQVLSERSNARGILFDLPHVVENARRLWSEGPEAVRCEAVGGSFFDGVVEGGDLYPLKHILHDWSDEDCVLILRQVRAALPKGGRVAVIEMLLPEDGTPHPGWGCDLVKLAVTGGGRERTLREYATLLDSAGLKVDQVTGSDALISIVEAVPA